MKKNSGQANSGEGSPGFICSVLFTELIGLVQERKIEIDMNLKLLGWLVVEAKYSDF